LCDYQRHWVYQDHRVEPGLRVPVGCPVTERTLQVPNWHTSAILNEFLLPSDVPYFMPAWLHKSATKAVALSFQATRKRGPFETQDLETYRQMLPHISRALEIRDRLEEARVRADLLAHQLDAVSFGIAVLDDAGRIVEANVVVQQLLRADCGLRCGADNILVLRDPAGARLIRWISTGVPPTHNADCLLHLPRPHGPPLSILVTPLPTRTISWIRGDARWLLLIFDPDRRVPACTEIIARDLGISAREAEVAALLVTGYNLHEVAVRLRVSEHTVRSQLKSIFRKTTIRSQSDLIRRVALGAAGCMMRAIA
jgi:DNA-binding CsgD family transcriptional regulator